MWLWNLNGANFFPVVATFDTQSASKTTNTCRQRQSLRIEKHFYNRRIKFKEFWLELKHWRTNLKWKICTATKNIFIVLWLTFEFVDSMCIFLTLRYFRVLLQVKCNLLVKYTLNPFMTFFGRRKIASFVFLRNSGPIGLPLKYAFPYHYFRLMLFGKRSKFVGFFAVPHQNIFHLKFFFFLKCHAPVQRIRMASCGRPQLILK